MAEGFVLDQAYDGSRSVPRWLDGAPEKSFWRGIKLRGRTPLQIVTWRCTGCSYLESYATP